MEYNDSNNLLIISCIFGNKFAKVYPAPFSNNCYFFTNNPKLKDTIINNKWNYIYINCKLTSDIIKSSLQSKYIKFLQFLKHFPQFLKYSKILYFDHKFNINNKWLKIINDTILNNINYNIIIRKTPKIKLTIDDEIKDAIHQFRYKKNINKTKLFIKTLIQNNKISNNVRICNTGLIIYNNYNDIIPMLNNIFECCVKHEQPECQIYWSIYSQFYVDKILKIEFNDLNPLWHLP